MFKECLSVNIFTTALSFVCYSISMKNLEVICPEARNSFVTGEVNNHFNEISLKVLPRNSPP